MKKLNMGGPRPPAEFERTLDEMLDAEVCDACNQIEALDLGEHTGRQETRARWETFLMGCFFLILSFGIAVWWENYNELGAEPLNAPEVTIGVDPNGAITY